MVYNLRRPRYAPYQAANDAARAAVFREFRIALSHIRARKSVAPKRYQAKGARRQMTGKPIRKYVRK